ncbi:hypothetical protein BKH43_06490 [Helicobacter sp. 13S00401-1]|uniref:HAD family hydrolase n=1 Tax=Helicobacter sp. 13S00401-1 TaxID=1905758 RepID=UPI000BA53493|nr:hypothetical protein [Helicobacter sp. 13S00401-1]PAF49651.1 hypothetical protein BKH43_06490 [Helicobacter sp. 13S00401-1]
MSDEIRLYSYDVFDTLLTRKVARPTGIFTLMQERLKNDPLFLDFPASLKTNFFNYRVDSEYRLRCLSRKYNFGFDVNLDSIYEDIRRTLSLTLSQTILLKDLEIAIESENIVPIKANIDKIKALVASGKKVVLISDMYLPFSVVKSFLARLDPLLNTLTLYLSSEVGFMKATKQMYKYVQDKEKVSFKEWEHVGDNKHADYNNALSLGIKAKLYNFMKLESYEERLLNSHPKSFFTQLSVGCSRNLRLANTGANSNMYDLGASLGGPLFYPFILWLLEQTKRRGITRLYFIARDGYILKKMMDMAIESKGLKIDTKYIYGSRKAWRLPALSIDNTKLYEQFVESYLRNLKNLHAGFNMIKSEFISILPKGLKKYYKGLSLKKLQDLKDFLLSNASLLARLVEVSADKRKLVIRYLREELDLSDDNFAFIDLDGAGLTQNALACLLQDFFSKPIKCFYFASTPGIFTMINTEHIYFHAFRRGDSGILLELLTRAPHGQTLGYRLKDGVCIPILENIKVNKDGLEDYIKGVLDYTHIMLENKAYKSFVSQDILESYVRFLSTDIDKKHAEILGDIKHSYMGKETSFAPKFSFYSALKYLLSQKADTENVLYSKIRSNVFIRKMLSLRSMPIRVLKKLKRSAFKT